jgi:hypothetical protein
MVTYPDGYGLWLSPDAARVVYSGESKNKKGEKKKKNSKISTVMRSLFPPGREKNSRY